jgi:hypothetical protein
LLTVFYIRALFGQQPFNRAIPTGRVRGNVPCVQDTFNQPAQAAAAIVSRSVPARPQYVGDVLGSDRSHRPRIEFGRHVVCEQRLVVSPRARRPFSGMIREIGIGGRAERLALGSTRNDRNAPPLVSHERCAVTASGSGRHRGGGPDTATVDFSVAGAKPVNPIAPTVADEEV